MSATLAPSTLLEGLVLDLESMLESELGELDAICAPAAVVLAVRLREEGLLPCVETGLYRDDESGVLEPHAYVRLADLILDPTRGQFDEGPRLSCDDPHYLAHDEDWGPGMAPPARPSYADARHFIASWWCAIDCGVDRRASMLRVLDAFERRRESGGLRL